MYEGSNIHFSPFDNKPLCSYSTKLCKQRRLNGYAFCVRHILEDQGAPYKQCCYVSKYSKQTCINSIPKAEERLYCNNHLQMLGLIPKKERKPKEKIKEIREHDKDDIKDNCVTIETKSIMEKGIRTKFSRSKFTMRQNSECLKVSTKDPQDDPYAFPEDPVSEPTPKSEPSKLGFSPGFSPSQPVNTFTDVINRNPSPGTNNHLTPKSVWSTRAISVEKSPQSENSNEGKNMSQNCSSVDSGFSIAKLYPELAEKLERTKMKAAEPQQRKETKSQKSQSRTMNRLQTKIAQNKIKDKLKRNLSNHTTPEHQPSTPQTPSAISSGYENGSNCSQKNYQHFMETQSQSSSLSEKNTLKMTIPTADGVTLRMTLPSEEEVPLKLALPSEDETGSAFARLNELVSPHNISTKEANCHSVEQEFRLSSHIPYPHVPDTRPAQTLKKAPASNLVTQSGPAQTLKQVPAIQSAQTLKQAPAIQSAQRLKEAPASNHVTQSVPAQTFKQTPACNIVTPSVSAHTLKQAPASHSVTNSSLKQESLINSSSSPHHCQTVQASHTHPCYPIDPPAPPCYFTSMPPPSLHQPTARLPVLYSRPKRTRKVLSEKEARKRLKLPSAVRAYAYHASQRMIDNDLLSADFDSSSEESDNADELPWQHLSYSPSSDEEDMGDDSPVYARITKISLLRARLRRQFMQLRRSVSDNMALHNYQMKALHAIVESAKHSPTATCRAIKEMKGKDNNQAICSMKKKYCLHKTDDVVCHQVALPYTNHCKKHIMYNVDQQLFDYCTAKFSDNTQCCVPVFDTRHELPLCKEHAAKADNYNRNLEPKQKKPRKKTKPSALTRPPKRGKKKKNQKRNLRPQKPMPPLEPTGDVEMPQSDVDVNPTSPVGHQEPAQNAVTTNHIDTELAEVAMAIQKQHQSAQTPEPDLAEDLGVSLSPSTIEKTLDLRSIVKNMDLNFAEKNIDLRSFEKNLDIRHMEKNLDIRTIEKDLGIQIAESGPSQRFIDVDDRDLHAVLDKIPEEAFDLFAERNGEFLPTREETEELERALAQASREVVDAEKSLEQFSQDTSLNIGEDSNGSDELTKQIADTILNQHLSPAESITDDLSADNINALANSISANDFKNMSQELTSSDLTTTLTQQQQQQHHHHHNSQVPNHSHQNHSQMIGNLSQIPVNRPALPGSVSTSAPNSTTSGGFSVLQAQLNQGPLAPSQLQLQLNHSSSHKLPSVQSLHRQLSANQTSNAILVQQAGHLPPLSVPSQNHLGTIQPSQVINFRPIMNQLGPNNANFTPVTFQNGFPLNHQGSFPIQGIPGSGVKVAYPIQMIQGNLGTVVAQPVTMATALNQIGQNNVHLQLGNQSNTLVSTQPPSQQQNTVIPHPST